MSTHVITVDIGAGLEQIEVDDQLLVRIRLAASDARLQREREQRRRRGNVYVNYGGLFGGQTFTFTSDFAADPGLFEHLFGEARQPAGGEPHVRAEQPSRPATPRTTTEALDVLAHYAGESVAHNRDAVRKALRRAKRAAHPDTGGTSADFQLVTAAEDVLRNAHWI